MDKKQAKYLEISLSKSCSILFAEGTHLLFLFSNTLYVFSTFPQFGAKLISLYLFSPKICEKLHKNSITTLWISSVSGLPDGGCGYPQSCFPVMNRVIQALFHENVDKRKAGFSAWKSLLVGWVEWEFQFLEMTALIFCIISSGDMFFMQAKSPRTQGLLP